MTIQAFNSAENQYGYVKDGKVYLKSCLNNPDRVIGDVKNTEEEALKYFENRFKLLENKISQMIQKMHQAENKGSFLMQTLHLKQLLNTYNALGDFEKLKTQLEAAEQEIKNVIAENREKNLILKKQLLKEGFEILKLEDPREKVLQLKEFRMNWLQVGAVPEEYADDIEADYQEILGHYHQLREAYFEQRSKQIEECEAKFKGIIQRARELSKMYEKESLVALEEINQLEEDWKKTDNIPKQIYAPLLNEFKDLKRLVLKNVKKYKKSISPRDPKRIFFPKYIPEHEAELYENLKHRLNLIEEAKSLNRMEIRIANERAKELQQRWKNAGMIPEKFKSEVYHQFNLYCDRIFELSYLMRSVFARNPYFRDLSKQDQVELKMEVMNEIIQKEEAEIEKVAQSFDNMSAEEKNLPENKVLFTRLNTSKRKLKAKMRLLEELKEELQRILHGHKPRNQRFDNRNSGGNWSSHRNQNDDRRGNYSGRNYQSGDNKRRYDNRGNERYGRPTPPPNENRGQWSSNREGKSYQMPTRKPDDFEDYFNNSPVDKGY